MLLYYLFEENLIVFACLLKLKLNFSASMESNRWWFSFRWWCESFKNSNSSFSIWLRFDDGIFTFSEFNFLWGRICVLVMNVPVYGYVYANNILFVNIKQIQSLLFGITLSLCGCYQFNNNNCESLIFEMGINVLMVLMGGNGVRHEE